jgi:Ig-like domain from next to BRCA1 gene/SdrD B-like domain
MRSFLFALLCSLALAACTPTGGVVQGVVYADLNGNGANEAGEGPLQGVDVNLTGCGAAQTQTTGADGAFSFVGLPAGSCLVQVSKAGWAFSGSFPSLGYPIPVASDPNLPTSFSIFMAPQASCTNALDITFSTPLQKTYMAPGQGFVMSWTVVNQGTCSWGDGYHLVFEGGPSPSEGGSSMGAPLDIPLSSLVTIPVLPGQQVVISLNQTAPMQAGWYVGSWKLVAPNGDTMPNVCLCTDIVVQEGGSIGGMVWHDLCALPDGPLPPAPPPGCIPSGGSYEANGILEAGEPGLAGVTVRLGSGICPSSGLATAVTGPDGTYSFPGLVSGDYCVSVGALVDGNDTILIPGGWTAPVAHVDPQAVSVSLSEGQAYAGLNFGWDYQFLPAWTAPTPTAAMEGFSAPQSSSDMFYYRGAGCGPKEIDLRVQATYPNVRNVVLFFRLKDKSGGETTAWNEGEAMMPQGGGMFNFTLASETIPGFTSFAEAILQYQFVAEGGGGAILGRSQVYSDVELNVCHQ